MNLRQPFKSFTAPSGLLSRFPRSKAKGRSMWPSIIRSFGGPRAWADSRSIGSRSISCDGEKLLDSTTKRIGLRTLRAVPQTAAMPLHFEVNGVPFFAKGANWIPADCFANRLTKDILSPLCRRRRGGQHEHAAILGRRILRGRRPLRPLRRAGHLHLARSQVRLLDLPGL